MKINPYIYAGLIVLLVAGIGYNFQKNQELRPTALPVPVVVELFTSKNCPSCPPADRVLALLAKDKNILTLSCHVSYWDFGTNKDDFAREFCEVRQHGFASLSDEKRIFTPQIIVNGDRSVVGGQTADLKDALSDALKTPPALVELKEDEDRTVRISLPQLEGMDKLRVWAFGYGRHDNKDSDRPITNPALSLDNLGSWDGKPETRQLQVMSKAVDGILVLVQDNSYGRIVAAGRITLR